MDNWTLGADVATMLTGASALTAAAVWTGGRWSAFRERRAARRYRVWESGYIMNGLIFTWAVRLAADDPGSTARVVLEVLDGHQGQPAGQLAAGLRNTVTSEGWLSRAPSPDQARFLRDLEKARRRGGFPVR